MENLAGTFLCYEIKSISILQIVQISGLNHSLVNKDIPLSEWKQNETHHRLTL